MIKLVRTNATDTDFLHLVSLLDKELVEIYGEAQSFFGRFNSLSSIPYTVVAYHDNTPVGCGSIKPVQENMAEVKRMYVTEALRGQGIAGDILKELESWAKELNFSACILQTGDKQPKAVSLYQKKGYYMIPNYDQYENDESSICMRKDL